MERVQAKQGAKRERRYRLAVLLLLVGAGVVIVLDGTYLLAGNMPATFHVLREFLFAGLLVVAAPLVWRSPRLVDRPLTRQLKNVLLLFAAVLAWWLALQGVRFGVAGPQLMAGADRPRLALGAALFGVGASALMLAILGIIRRLILYKRTPTTRRNLRILVVLFLAVLLEAAVHGSERVAGGMGRVFWRTSLGEVLLFLLIVAMVVNAFRNAWVNFLNKRQKIRAFWGGVPVLVMAASLIGVSQDPWMEQYSLVLTKFLFTGSLFVTIYASMSLISLLLHLPTASIYDQRMREISALHDLSHVAISVFDIGQLAETIVVQTVQNVRPSAAWLELLDPKAKRLYLAAAYGLSDREMESINLDPQAGLSGLVIAQGAAVVINDIDYDERAQSVRSWCPRFGSLVGVPLSVHGRVVGILFAAKLEDHAFDEDERSLLEAFANQAAVAVHNAQLVRESLEKERLEQELRVAHEAQMKLLPKSMPEVPGVEIDAVSIPANEVGGDYYDFFDLGDRLGLVVGDVSGKGPQAAFYMAEVKGIIEALSRIYASPRELLIRVNETLYHTLDRQAFVTLIYAVIDPQLRRLVFSRAGHTPVLYASANGAVPRYLEPPGLGLGLDRGELFKKVITEEHVELKPGDVLVFYTDGVIEARDTTQTEFDEERLLELVSSTDCTSSHELKEHIVEEVRKFVGDAKVHDDLTLVVVRVK